MINPHRSLAVTALVVAGCAGGVAGAAVTEAPVSQDGAITVAHAKVAGTDLTISFESSLHGAPGHRDVGLTFGDEPPDVEDDEGNIMSEGGISSIFHRIAERGRLSLSVETNWPETCVRLMVAGTATARVAKVRVLHADGRKTPIRLQTPPRSWHYRGHYYGEFVRTASPPRSIRAFDRAGHLLHATELPRQCGQLTA